MTFSPHILSRVPDIDKPSIAFPNQVTEVLIIYHEIK